MAWPQEQPLCMFSLPEQCSHVLHLPLYSAFKSTSTSQPSLGHDGAVFAAHQHWLMRDDSLMIRQRDQATQTGQANTGYGATLQ